MPKRPGRAMSLGGRPNGGPVWRCLSALLGWKSFPMRRDYLRVTFKQSKTFWEAHGRVIKQGDKG